MSSEKSDAEMRLLLQQIARVERNSPPSYPNYKQGIIAGVIVFLLAAMIAVLLMIGGSNSNFVLPFSFWEHSVRKNESAILRQRNLTFDRDGIL